MIHRSFFLLLGFLAIVADGQMTTSLQAIESYDALVVHARAKNVKFSTSKGTEKVSYLLDVSFPASDVTTWLEGTLRDKGWKELKYDFLNPDLPSSLVEGWRKFIDASGNTRYVVHSWAVDWIDQSENVTRYTMQYRYSENSNTDLKNLHVTGIYIPAAIAKRGREAANK